MLNKKYIYLCLGMLLIAHVFAIDSNSKPIQIEANHATVDQKEMQTVFAGNIVITRGSLIIEADKGVANQDKSGDRILDLYGSPVVFQQLTEDGKKITGQCNHFNYNTKTNLAILMDRARVKKGKSIIIGDKLTYNTATQVYSAVSDLGNGITQKTTGRVTVILDQNDINQVKASVPSKKGASVAKNNSSSSLSR